MFFLLRRFERWLHQHIFKVGWLLTKDYQTTTILYYTFLLPGVILHELVYWLAAGFLDVRAERTVSMPEKQEIGELRLNFVKLSKKAGRIKTAIIATAPLLVGLFIIWLIANRIFNVPEITTELSDGTLAGLSRAINHILRIPDIWLWLYLMFTISNTMMPSNPKDLRGWWIILGGGAAVVVMLFLLGIGDEIVRNGLIGPINSALNVLSGTFGIIMVCDVFVTAILALIENTIEWITGDSAMFRDGKMITMRRSEAQAMREQERQRARQRKTRHVTEHTGPPSVYKFPLPIPGAPGREPVTQGASAIVGAERPADLSPAAALNRRGPSLITGEVSRPPTEAANEAATTSVSRPTSPKRLTPGETASDHKAGPPAPKEKEDKPALPLRQFGPALRPTPAVDKEKSGDEQEAAEERSSLAARLGGESPFRQPIRPGSAPTPSAGRSREANEDDDEEDTGSEEYTPARVSGLRPALSSDRPPVMPFPGRPESRPSADDVNNDETADEGSLPARTGDPSPPVNPFAARAKPAEPADEDEPPPARVSGFRPTLPPSRPGQNTGPQASPFRRPNEPHPDDDEEDEDDADRLRPFSAARSPNPFIRGPQRMETNEEDEDVENEPPPARVSGFRPTLPPSRPGQNADPLASPFRRPNEPHPDDDEEDEDDESVAGLRRSLRTSNPFARLSSDQDDDHD